MKTPEVADEFMERVQALKTLAERVVIARRRDNLGGTPAEAALMQSIKDAKRKVLRVMKESVEKIQRFKPDPVPVSAAKRERRVLAPDLCPD